jgi:hypothetical protein
MTSHEENEEPSYEPSPADWEWLNRELIDQDRRLNEKCCRTLKSRLEAIREEPDGRPEFPGIIPLALARFLANGNTHD